MAFVNRRVIFVAALLVSGGLRAETPTPPQAVLELFTSQGCSSCPSADLLVSEMAKDPSLLTLSFPVDYWDYLGWKDTLADKAFTARQRAYGDARGDRHIYTPQAIVNGSRHNVGSDRDAVNASRVAGRSKGAMSVALTATVDGETIRVAVPQAAQPPRMPATLVLLPVTRKAEVAIARGENKGRTVTYTNVVREIVPVGTWDGAAKSFEAPASLMKMRNADTFAVLLQEGTPEKPGLILGAAKGPGL
ncbi:DUF1223 domain-containing protein [Alsobacter sp. R-9]